MLSQMSTRVGWLLGDMGCLGDRF